MNEHSSCFGLAMAVKCLALMCVFLPELVVGANPMDVPEDTLVASLEFPRADDNVSLARPREISISPDGKVIVLDTENHRLVAFDTDGRLLKTAGTIGMGPLEFSSPRSLAFSDKYLFIADTGNDRVCILDLDLNWIGDFETPARPDILLVDGVEHVWVGSTLDLPGDFLLVKYSLDGEAHEHMGTLIGDLKYDHLTKTTINKVIVSWLGQDSVLYCHKGVPYCRICDIYDNQLGSFLLRHDLAKTRRFFFDNFFKGTRDTKPIEQCTLSDYISDLVDKMPFDPSTRVPLYISQVYKHNGRILLLASSCIHEYEFDGSLVRRSVLATPSGERIVFDNFAIDSSGNIFTSSMFFEQTCWKVKY